MSALEVEEPKKIFSLVIKTKLVQNVNRMSERQNDMPKDRLTDRQIKTKRLFSLVIKTKVQNVRRQTDDRQTDFSA